MTLRFVLSAALIAFSTSSFAQVWQQDSVAMGVGYANDVFYKLGDGSTKLQQGNDWHLAFQMGIYGEPDFNASVRANHVRTGMEVYVINNTAITTFGSVGAADTIGKTSASMALNNKESSWGTGAFYMNRNPLDIYSFGWGEYSGPPNHYVNGNVTYLLKMLDGTAYKFWIMKYISINTQTDTMGYSFRIAKLDGSTPVKTVTIHRQDANYNFTDRLQAYYNIDSDRIENREPMRVNWDLLFTQYRDSVAMGPGVKVLYPVTGVLNNNSSQVVNVYQINPDASLYATRNYSSNINTIGYDWKVYVNPGPNGYYQMNDTNNYFIKKATSSPYVFEYYQLQFTRFDGGGAAGQGKIVFAKRALGMSGVGVGNIPSAVNAWFVTPNPSNTAASVMIDAKTATPAAQLLVTDMAGRVVFSSAVSVKQGMNGFSMNTAAWADGIYAVKVAGSGLNLSTRLVVAH